MQSAVNLLPHFTIILLSFAETNVELYIFQISFCQREYKQLIKYKK